MTIDANGVHYREVNERIHAALNDGPDSLTIRNVRGQRYIGVGIGNGARLTVCGVPGNDLGAFMNGAEIIVRGNAQDGVGNTMNAGRIVIHGDAGDVVGYAMRGGKIFVRGNVGYRIGIHMKAYGENFPVIVVGGTAKDYAGEYMAGGVLVLLNSGSPNSAPAGDYLGTGMHGGVIYARGRVEACQLGKEVGEDALDESDWAMLKSLLAEYRREFGVDVSQFRRDDFVRLTPRSARPYGRLYAY
ncbi:MAG: hypothetical protein ACE5O2_08030 [Armatimonadota bacterium]